MVKYPKIVLKNGFERWRDCFAHERANLLRKAGVSDITEIQKLVNYAYVQLPSDVRYNIENIISSGTVF